MSETLGTTANELKHAEIIALRTLSDGISQLNTSVNGLATDMRDVRERLIEIEALKIEARHEKLEAKFETAVANFDRQRQHLIDQHAADHEKLSARVAEGENKFAKFSGIFVPLSVFGAALLTGAASFMLDRLFH